MQDASSKPTLVLTNDDGIDAAGLAALRRAVEGFGRIVIVAPDGPQSSCSRMVTTHRPIRVEAHGEDCYAVGGTPADCVRLALLHLAPGASWILSGINHGGNLGADIPHSGTVAAVLEGLTLGCPGIAFSHYIVRKRELDWDRASGWVRRLLEQLLRDPRPSLSFWNVNLPHPEPGADFPEVVECQADTNPLPFHYDLESGEAHYRSDYHNRPRSVGTDVDLCFGGKITLSRLQPWDLRNVGSSGPSANL